MTDEYRIETTPNSIDFWSKHRLPLEPNGVLFIARIELREKLKSLKPRLGDGLWASLTTECHDHFDAENILFYNVGAARFGALSSEGYSFSFFRGAPVEAAQFKFHHHYELRRLPAKAASQPHLQFVLEKLNTNIKPQHVWWPARNAGGMDIPVVEGDFRLDVVLTGPAIKSGIATVAKPLLDGVIAALHFDSCVDQAAVSFLASKFQLPADRLLKAFARTDHSPLGDQRVLSTYRGPTSIKWNPADERCVECAIRWLPGSGPGTRVDVCIQPTNG
ncbi:MAG: hypothetical protein Q8O29_06960 [Polaromonas sp.]|uniref:hypothetical protein n=1 Tax=Polaromonas sp. TaxID=1869339 RepID=UPI0027323D1A|nr:hypothetical protein [Polaromonas sp.]MDP2818011.1 hypothetical protein [Polaromonas sp.]